MKPYISIIIPAFNEEERIESSLDKAYKYLEKQDYSFEIILADDGSSDSTVKTVRDYDDNIKIVELGRNIGKGAAVREGMLAASGDIRVFTDADFSTPIYEVEKIIYSIKNGFDVVIGSRAKDYTMIKEHQPAYRELMGKTFNKLVRFFVIDGISDTQCGFKGFTAEAAEKIFSNAKINGFSFDVEILYLAKKEKLLIDEIPVEWYNDERSKVNPVTDSLKMLWEILRIKKLHGL